VNEQRHGLTLRRVQWTRACRADGVGGAQGRKPRGQQVAGLTCCSADRSTRDLVRQRGERGGGSMLMVGVLTVLLMIGVTGVVVAGYLVAAHRVRTAADLAALSGAAAVASGADGCPAARSNARSNGARLVECGQVGDAVDFVVTVRAEVRVQVMFPGLPQRLGAVAHAGSEAE
jgi:secretion/DNA translocation related TadE-like protein